MTGRLDGRTALITGSGQNIGRSIARLFAQEGARVIVNGHSNQKAVDDVVHEIEDTGGTAVGIMADVSDPAAVATLVEQGTSLLGTIDIAVNNVARRKRQPLEEISIADWQETINYNLNSAFYVAHHVLPGMRKSGWGRIVNIAGYDGWTGHIPQRAHNVAAKAGLHGLTKAIAREAGVWGIKCSSAPVAVASATSGLARVKRPSSSVFCRSRAARDASPLRESIRAKPYFAITAAASGWVTPSRPDVRTDIENTSAGSSILSVTRSISCP